MPSKAVTLPTFHRLRSALSAVSVSEQPSNSGLPSIVSSRTQKRYAMLATFRVSHCSMGPFMASTAAGSDTHAVTATRRSVSRGVKHSVTPQP